MPPDETSAQWLADLGAEGAVRDNAEARTRLQDRYRFLLIDELQDTDPVQMELVESLCGAELTAGKLFAVGDPSQSIYRFRGADVYLFQGLRQRMAQHGPCTTGLPFFQSRRLSQSSRFVCAGFQAW